MSYFPTYHGLIAAANYARPTEPALAEQIDNLSQTWVYKDGTHWSKYAASLELLLTRSDVELDALKIDRALIAERIKEIYRKQSDV